MANGKKSFLIYCDVIHTVEHLTNEEKGILFQHLLDYVNDNSPVLETRVLKIAFEPIKRQLKRDLKNWESTKSERSRSGNLGNLKRWNKDLYNDVINKNKTLDESLIIAKGRIANKSIAKVAKVAVNDNVNVNVNESEYNALDILKNETMKWEVFTSQNKNRIKDWDKMLELFSYKADEEKLEYDYKILINRLRRWMSSWETNQELTKDKPPANSNYTENPYGY